MSSPFKHILSAFRSHMGEITVYKNYGSDQQIEQVIPKALKNTEGKNGGGRNVFQFEERQDIAEGDIIQQKNSQFLWRVTELEEMIDGDEFIMFEAFVEKATATGASRPKPGAGHSVNISGNVYGALQVGVSQSSQSVSVTLNQQVSSSLQQLTTAVRDSDLDELDREEVLHEIGRVEELAKRGDEKAKPKLIERLKVIEKSVEVSQKLARVALPIIATLRSYFGL